MHILSPLLDPLLRPRKPPAALSFFLVTLLLAGCVSEPSPPRAGGSLPLHVQNATDAPRDVHVEVRDAEAATLLMGKDVRVPPRSSATAAMGLLGHGDYVLVAQTDGLAREARVDFDATVQFYRFVIEHDVIAFQSA